MIIEPKRTPAPWEVWQDTDIINQAEGQVCRCETKADAEFIVTACNAHDQLVEALKLARGIASDANANLREENGVSAATISDASRTLTTLCLGIDAALIAAGAQP